jgi:hypothetical protein
MHGIVTFVYLRLTPAIVSASPDYRAHSTEPHKTDTGGYDDNSAIMGLVLDAVSIHMRLLVRREGTARTATTRGTAYAEPKWVTGNIKLVTTCSTICGMRAMRQ